MGKSYLLRVRQEIRCALCVNRHYKTQHQTEIEGKPKLVHGPELRKEYVTKKYEEIRRQNVFIKKRCERIDEKRLI